MWISLLIPVLLFCIALMIYHVMAPKLIALREPTWGALGGGMLLIMIAVIMRSSEPLPWAILFSVIFVFAIVGKLRHIRSHAR